MHSREGSDGQTLVSLWTEEDQACSGLPVGTGGGKNQRAQVDQMSSLVGE